MDRRSALAAPLLALWCATGAVAEEGARPTPVRIDVTEPAAGATVRGRFERLPLSGLADAGARERRFDVIMLVDVSGSTKGPSGGDIDGDGLVGETEKPSLVRRMTGTAQLNSNTDPGDSILAAEVAAGLELIRSLEPGRVQLGLVTFSGRIDPITLGLDTREPSAVVEQPLTTDFDAVSRALEAVKLRGSYGGTDMQAGIKLAVSELAGLQGAKSTPRPGAERVVLLLTDGMPAFPFGRADLQDKEDLEATAQAAELAAQAGVQINVYGLGPGAISYPEAATQVARLTSGTYVPIRRPGDIVAVLSGVSFADVEDVVAINLTLAEMAAPEDIMVRPDGSFRGFVPVRPGRNRIRISALASDGSRGSTEFEVDYLRQELSDTELDEELERVRERNREIQLLTERKRQEAFRKAERERGITLEVEKQNDVDDGETEP